jgi:hypothetical protein
MMDPVNPDNSPVQYPAIKIRPIPIPGPEINDETDGIGESGSTCATVNLRECQGVEL